MFAHGEGVCRQNGVGPFLTEGPAYGVGGRVSSAGLRALLLAPPVLIYSDLKDKTEAIVSGMILGHRLFRNGRYLTTHHSHP